MYRAIVIGHEGSIVHEANASEAGILPGMLVEHVPSGGTAGEFRKNAAAKGPVLVAEENDMFGGGLNDAYPINAQVRARALKPGAEFLALVAAGNPAIAYGANLMQSSANPGCVIASSGDALTAFEAMQGVDNSAGGAAVRIRVRVL